MLLSRSLRQLRSRSVFSAARLVPRAFFFDAREENRHWTPLVDRAADYSGFEYDAFAIAMQKKRKLDSEHHKRHRKQDVAAQGLIEGTPDEILEIEVTNLFQRSKGEPEDTEVGASASNSETQGKPVQKSPPVTIGKEYEVDIIQLSSTGDGLGFAPSGDHIVVVPFTVPGDRAVARIYRTCGLYSRADYQSLVKPSPMRDGVTPPCKYFSECGGCQFQMISYEDQLKHKKTIVEKAFRYFSGLPSDQVPDVLDTMGSPLQYGYRTKLTPHFHRPRRPQNAAGFEDPEAEREVPPIGFNKRALSITMDIEQCPIGTEVLNEGMKIQRAKVAEKLDTYKRGSTLLLRESTIRQPMHNQTDAKKSVDADDLSFCNFDEPPTSTELKMLRNGEPMIQVTYPTYTDRKTVVTDMGGLSTEYIGPYKFVNRAGSFFQNNNSILLPFTDYVRDQVIPKTDASVAPANPNSSIKYLLDAYCGSGLFTITLSPLFSSALGIDIDFRGIEAARMNADANSIPNAGFIDADASALFADVPYPPDQSLVVIDPPRRGASEDFLRQLCKFRARRVIYVSCNVHTQARDVGMIVKGFKDEPKSCRYEIESLRGFDFFPQTGHVEGVCVLNRVDEA